MISIALCDDEDKYLSRYETILSSYFKEKKLAFEIIKFKSGESFLFNLEDNINRFQIVFLDILMHELNGIETAKKIRELNENVNLIFLTSSEMYVYDAFEANPVNYLIKDKDEEKLHKVLDKVMKKLEVSVTNDNFVYKKANSYISFSYDSIMYFEVFQRIITIHRYKEDKHDFYCSFKELDSIIDQNRFVKIFRSYIVNMSYIQKIYNHQVELKDGTLLPISRKLYDDVKKKFSLYLNSEV